MQAAIGRATAGKGAVVPTFERELPHAESCRGLSQFREAIGLLFGCIEPNMDGEIDLARRELAIPPRGRGTVPDETELLCDRTIRRLRRIDEKYIKLPTPLRHVKAGTT